MPFNIIGGNVKKVGIIIISILLILSVGASGIGYYYNSNRNNDKIENNNEIEDNKTTNEEDNKNENNDSTNNTIITDECSYESLPKKYSEELENACKINNRKYINIYYYDYTFKKGEAYDKSYIDDINIDNAFLLKNEKISNEEKGNTLMLLINNGTLGCYLKNILLNFYNKETNSSETNIDKFFPNAEITENFICINKKIEKNHVQLLTDSDLDLPNVYLLNDKYYILEYDNKLVNFSSNENDLIDAGFEKIDL